MSLLSELAALRAASQTTPPGKVIGLLERCGFVMELEVPGSRLYAHPALAGPPLAIPATGPLRPALVKKVASAIEEVMGDGPEVA